MLAVPMFRADELLGVIVIYRHEVRPFTEDQIALMETFADQAAIAIENVRLFNETKEALERQTATAAILKVISGSPTNVQPIFEAVAERSCRTRCHCASVLIADNDVLRIGARVGRGPAFTELPIRRTLVNGRAFLERRTVHVEDIVPLLDTEYPDARENQRRSDYRTNLAVPMIHEGRAIGTIGIWRDEVKPFTPAPDRTARDLCRQAVVRSKVCRLSNQTKEALERQTATAEILKVISRSPDVQPVFSEVIARNAVTLCEGVFSTVFRYDGERAFCRAKQSGTSVGSDASRALSQAAGCRAWSGRAILTGEVVRIEDTDSDPDYDRRRCRGRLAAKHGGADAA